MFAVPTPSLTTLLIVPGPFLLVLAALVLLNLLPVLPTTLPQLKALLPSRNAKLPREFFGLEPRQPRAASPIPGVRDGNGFSIRAKVLLLLTVQAIISLSCGWAWLIATASGRAPAALLAVSITLVPATVLSLATFHLLPAGISRVTKATLWSRIVPLALGITLLPTVLVNFVNAQATLLATSTAIIGVLGLISVHYAIRSLRTRGVIGRRRAIRKRYLLSPRPEREKSFYDAGLESDEEYDRGSSWITSPSQPATLPSSSFSFSPESSLRTPHHSIRTTNSWVTSPTVTPKSLPEWSFDTVSPESAVTRPRSPSGRSMASNRSDDSGYLPSVTGTPATSRTSYIRASHDSVANARNRASSAASSTWTASFHSAMSFTNLPPPPPLPHDVPLPPTPQSWRRKEREWDLESAPCTPKQSSDRLVDRDRDWVALDAYEADGLDFEWGKNVAARRVGSAAIVGLIGCWTLCVPLLTTRGDSTTPVILYLLALVLPSPILAALHFLPTTSVVLPSRPSGSTLPSETTLVTHRSLALVNNSQLSLPVTLSPQLTPPEQRKPAPNSPANARWSKILAPKPSLTGFQGQNATNRRSSDVWIETGHARNDTNRLSRALEMLKPVPALQVLSTEPKRESWMKTKLRHGVESIAGSLQYAEPVQEESPPRPSNVTIEISSPSKFDRARERSQSGVDSEYDTTFASVRQAQVQTAMRARMSSSPTFLFSKPKSPELKATFKAMERPVNRRESWTVGKRAATLEAKSRRRTVDLGEYELDWISAAVLPGLLPDVKLGKIKVQPTPQSPEPRASTSTDATAPLPEFRPSQDFLPSMTPASRRSHGYSSSIDLSQSPDFHNAMVSTPNDGMRRRGHRSNASLPHIRPEGFADDVECHLAQVVVTDSPLRPEQLERLGIRLASPGQDLPPFPVDRQPSPLSTRGLTPVTEGDEGSSSSHSPAPSMDERTTQLVVNQMERMLEMDSPARSEFIASGDSISLQPSAMESIPSLRDDRSQRTLVSKRSDDTIASSSGSHLGTPSPHPHGIRPTRADLQLLPKPKGSTRSTFVVYSDESSSNARSIVKSKGLRPLRVVDTNIDTSRSMTASKGSKEERNKSAALKPKRLAVGVAKSPAAHPKMRWSQGQEQSHAYQARV